MSADTAELIRSIAARPEETAGVLFGHVAVREGDTARITVSRVAEVPSAAYVRRDARGLGISSGGYVGYLQEAAESGQTAMWFHTHPGEASCVLPSRLDGQVDDDLQDLFQIRTGAPWYVSVVFGLTQGRLTFSGRLLSAGTALSLDRILIVGSGFQVISAADAETFDPSEEFDRNVRAFGGDIQNALSQLSVAIVGCGGTGSAVAEQLVRLGVRRFLLIDPDRITPSNVTRVYGSTPADGGSLKVQVLRGHLEAVAPGAEVWVNAGSVVEESVARELSVVDLVFGCTDDNAGRLVLSRASTYLLLPVIDCGVLISSSEGVIEGVFGRVTVLHPGAACLVCRGRIDLGQAQAELLPPEERAVRVREGYAPEVVGREPAVIAYTTLTAAYAVNELLERFIGYGPSPRPSELLLRIHDRDVSTNWQDPTPGHYCDPRKERIGLASARPFLEQTWAA